MGPIVPMTGRMGRKMEIQAMTMWRKMECMMDCKTGQVLLVCKADQVDNFKAVSGTVPAVERKVVMANRVLMVTAKVCRLKLRDREDNRVTTPFIAQ